MDLKDASRSGRPTQVDDDKIKAMIENNRRSATREIAEKLNISHKCVERHLKQLCYVNKLDIWVLHKLNEIQYSKRISLCDSLLKRNETDPFLERITTSDEKWLVYDNVVRKRSWSKRDEPAQSTSKADIHQKKVMLSVWWDFKSIFYIELLARNQTFNSNDYCRKIFIIWINKLALKIMKKNGMTLLPTQYVDMLLTPFSPATSFANLWNRRHRVG